jgi:6-phosphogluconolactonase
MNRSRATSPCCLRLQVSVLLLVLAACLTACGGGGATNGGKTGGSGGGGTGGGQTAGPSTGEYVWEVSNAYALSYATIDTATGALSSPKSTSGPAGSAAGYPTVVVAPSNIAVYSFYYPTDSLETFAMSGPGVQLTWRAGHVFLFESSMTIHPSGKFLYVFQSGTPNSIQELSVNNAAGSLTVGPVVNENAEFGMGVIDPAGKFLFVSDGTQGRIFVYKIDQASGALSPVPGSPFSLPPNELPTVLAIGGSGNSLFLYANLERSVEYVPGIAAFAINNSTGALTAVAGSPFQPGVYGPDFICVEPSGKFLYSASSLEGINGFAIDQATGTLTAVPGSPYSMAPDGAMAVDPSGKFLYVTDEKDSTIYGFSLDPATGALSAIAGSPFTAVPQPEWLTMMKVP